MWVVTRHKEHAGPDHTASEVQPLPCLHCPHTPVVEQSLKGRACTPRNEHSVSCDIEAACHWGPHGNLVSTDQARSPTATEDAAPVFLWFSREVPNFLPSVLSLSSHLLLLGARHPSKKAFMLRAEQGLLSVLAIWVHNLLILSEAEQADLGKEKNVKIPDNCKDWSGAQQALTGASPRHRTVDF